MGSEISKQTLGMSPFLDPQSTGPSTAAKQYAQSPGLVSQQGLPPLVVPSKSMQKKAKFEKGQKGPGSTKVTSKVQPHAQSLRLKAKANNQIKLPHKLVPFSAWVAKVKERGKDVTKRFKKKSEVPDKQPSHAIAIEKPRTPTQQEGSIGLTLARDLRSCTKVNLEQVYTEHMKLRNELTQLIQTLSGGGVSPANRVIGKLRHARRRIQSIILYLDSPSDGDHDAT